MHVNSSRRRLLQALAASPMGLVGGSSALSQEHGATRTGCTPLLNETPASLPEMAHASQFGARFDGKSDDSAALQRAIDDAAKTQRMLILPGGTALLGSPLDLKGRYVAIRGQSFSGTRLKASRSMAAVIDAQEASDIIRSPLFLTDMTIDGSKLAAQGVALRYRHHSVLTNLDVLDVDIAIHEQDCWLSRRSNCRVGQSRIGWDLAGSNHSSIWDGCSFIGCAETHLRIAADGAAKDGNLALLFRACDVEFGPGAGIDIAANVVATFDTCYLGEDIGGAILRNRGQVQVRGGTFFFGSTPAAKGVVPLGGVVRFEGTRLSAQGAGAIAQFTGAAGRGETLNGRIGFRDVEGQMIVGGAQAWPGDVLDRAPMRTFAAPLGRDWMATAQQAIIAESSIANGRTVRCKAVGGNAPLIGLAAALIDTGWRDGEPLYFAIVYSASKPVELRLSHASHSAAPAYAIATLPATAEKMTFLKLEVKPPRADYRYLELYLEARAGDSLTLHAAAFSDNGFLKARAGTAFENLAMPA